ncbi:hypothetical protein ACFSYG_12800 [Leeuwenhoekiella polynyae]|uniref:PH (Pleckstrin Homology) domain-containing protein n=1 Tax=Leeuwenhoekiella polynyae TaxID=1550906 RepID=A0A4Q0NQ98_9FLAO|nr:hypothetical protein [Leeuwenhoekiella polynyae]RXG11903.1 hypothetical protein DSM02_4005 [Leeuwenhoekiella polynyae]
MRFDTLHKTLQVDDNQKLNNQFIGLVLSLSLLSSVLNLLNNYMEGISLNNIVATVLVVISAWLIFYLWKKKTSRTTIDLNEIECLAEISFFKKSYFYLKLADGKIRELESPQTRTGISDFKNQFLEQHIEIKKMYFFNLI